MKRQLEQMRSQGRREERSDSRRENQRENVRKEIADVGFSYHPTPAVVFSQTKWHATTTTFSSFRKSVYPVKCQYSQCCVDSLDSFSHCCTFCLDQNRDINHKNNNSKTTFKGKSKALSTNVAKMCIFSTRTPIVPV